jgi:hypothetical protein
MKKQLIPILGVAGLALTGLSIRAQVFNYTDGNLILDFSQSTATADVEVDLGSLSSLQGLSGGSTVSLGNFSSQLAAAGASINDLTFSIFGLQFSQNGSIAANTSWLTQTQTGASPNTPPPDLTGSNQNALKSNELGALGLQIDGVTLAGKGILPWSAGNAAGANNSANTVIIPNSNINSFTKLGTGTLLNGSVNHFQNTTSGTFSTDGGTYVSDLFELDPGLGSSTPSTFQGYFTLNNTGELDFTSVSAVPEPGTYSLLAAGGLLLLSFRKQLFRKQT